jgi:hypothetical protein
MLTICSVPISFRRNELMPADWPDYCCVPALVEAALGALGFSTPPKAELSRLLDIVVPPRDANPFGLRVAFPGEDTGIRLESALNLIPVLLRERFPEVSFSHIPFSRIPFEDYEGTYADLRSDGSFVGAGLNWPTLLGIAELSKHVLVVKDYGSQQVKLYDPLHPDRGDQEFTVVTFESAVRHIDDGFWTFSRRGC